MMGSTSYSITFLLFQLFLHLLLNTGRFQFGYANGCKTVEREALLKLKHSLSDPSNRLSSWKGEECCDWDGVGCDKITGHIRHLDLSGSTSTELRGHNLDPSLVNLTNLKYLNLGFNNFQESSIPEFFGSMKQLRYLDLTNASFGGALPPQLGNLTSLRYLYLSYNSFNGSVPLWLRNMKALEEILLGYNSFSHIEGGSLMGIVGNLCNLKLLDLSFNSIQGEIGDINNPKCMGNSLDSLILESNRMTGTLPSWLGDLRNLTDLRLNDNRFHGLIPTSIGRLSSLYLLELSSNSLEGTVSESHFANLSSLEYLWLGSNSLNLNFTSAWIPPFQLLEFNMSYCDIQGPFPQWIQTQQDLLFLDLSHNRIEGPFPQWIQTQYNLHILDLSHNRIVGPLTLLPSMLSIIRLSHNLLSGPLSQYQLFTNDYNATLPTSLCQLRGLIFIFLENNLFNGTIPNDCWSNSTSLNIINLSNNALEGQIPTTLFGTFQGLQILDLGENKLTGQVPSVTGTQLSILRLRDNQLGGVLPLQLCSLPLLQILDLANNSLAGSIPNCLGHLYGMSSKQEVIELSKYAGDEKIKEVLKGEILTYTTNKVYLVNMDLSCNGLVGSIPEELSNLSTLNGLNLSYNHLIGRIPEKIGQMTSLESLDLSNNNISGIIPASISALGFLSRLNLSHNKLHGEIPTGHQLQTLNDPSIYAGNSGLCGDPLPDKCKRSDKQEQGKQEESKQEDDEDDHFEKMVFCGIVILGFVTGFWGAIGTLLLQTQWRHALFQGVEDFMDYLYVQVVVKINRLKG